jgi:hypothetical protein
MHSDPASAGRDSAAEYRLLYFNSLLKKFPILDLSGIITISSDGNLIFGLIPFHLKCIRLLGTNMDAENLKKLKSRDRDRAYTENGNSFKI